MIQMGMMHTIACRLPEESCNGKEQLTRRARRLKVFVITRQNLPSKDGEAKVSDDFEMLQNCGVKRSQCFCGADK